MKILLIFLVFQMLGFSTPKVEMMVTVRDVQVHNLKIERQGLTMGMLPKGSLVRVSCDKELCYLEGDKDTYFPADSLAPICDMGQR